MGNRLAGRKILITGAASGIGLATAILFAEEGGRVAALDVNDPASSKGIPKDAACIQVDLLDRPKLIARGRNRG